MCVCVCVLCAAWSLLKVLEICQMMNHPGDFPNSRFLYIEIAIDWVSVLKSLFFVTSQSVSSFYWVEGRYPSIPLRGNWLTWLNTRSDPRVARERGMGSWREWPRQIHGEKVQWQIQKFWRVCSQISTRCKNHNYIHTKIYLLFGLYALDWFAARFLDWMFKYFE